MRVWVFYIYEPVPQIDLEDTSFRNGEICRRLVDAGHEVLWWNSTFLHFTKRQRFSESTTCRISNQYSVRFVHGPGYRKNVSLGRVWHNRIVASAMAKELAQRKETPDLMYVGIPCLEVADVVARSAVMRGVPLIVDAHDCWPDLYLRLFPRFLQFAGRVLMSTEFRRVKRICQAANGFTAVSASYLKWALGYAGRPAGPADSVFPLGYRAGRLLADSEAQTRFRDLQVKHGLPSDAFMLIFVGTFGASYDLETVVAAAREFSDRGDRGIHFVLVGTGDKFRDIQSATADLGNVTITGWLNKEDIWVLMQRAKVGLASYAPGATQSLPYKPFQYMAAGLPILSSLPGELEALLRETGVGRQCQAGSVRSLVEQIVWFREHSEDREAMSENARRVFRESFDMDVIYPRLVRHFERVVSQFEARRSAHLAHQGPAVVGGPRA